ncbi:replication initiation and membrane attachment family protein [Neobacillus thermocopriae]|uniref:Replication initiation and membrane attachment protein n=1 Tax=Neobacillus thermocopriae TaxID=1215031 RepID=A0A6B3TN90_9BACI|nr:replication initiation and membrane attachment family protein [Neobacillus thermocopriae]MED3622703.1 replication initiation and membrane attachment family protein [Neobacillus thermocopriae]MED3714139.1 replication initiation and membrane attachment family protein [Neobacillus thermocopriae]NEX78424.1 Replication initiation and membrane attachment protein [Neobacillus thermocopriae]
MAQHWQEILPIDRYIVTTNGLLHDYDRKVLTFLYQPLIGSTCFSLYMTLWSEVEENRLWAESSTHHLLMNLLGLNLKEIYEARLKLEGIGLLKTYVKTDDSERSFIYELQPPLSPEKFFLDGMLNIFLYRKIGKNHFARLKRFFSDQAIPKNGDYSEVTRAFQDVFSSATPESLQYLQEASKDLQAKENEQFIGRHEQKGIQIGIDTFDFDLLMIGLNESLVPKKALTPKVKEAISNLAFLYNIDAIQMKNIVLSALNESNEIDIEELRKAARDWYQFVNYDQLPMLIERTQPIAYRVQLEEPKTKEEKLIHYLETTSPLEFLKYLAGGAEPSQSEIQTIEEMMFKQKLLPGVINVLIHYVMEKTNRKLTKAYAGSIASTWARLQIKTVKEAMEVAKKEYKDWEKGKKQSGKTVRQKATRTELIPDWFDEDQPKKSDPLSHSKNEDLEAKKREIEEMLKAFDD